MEAGSPRPHRAQVEQFHEVGFLVLAGEIDPRPLSDEVDRVLGDGAPESAQTVSVGSGEVRFRYVPMMCEATPVSVGLVERLAVTAGLLVGRPVLPVRAKGARLYGDTGWHRDSEHGVASVGFVAYLEPVSAATGALRVVPGSHRRDTPGEGRADLAGEALATSPGDVIVFDEHLMHGSAGGEQRRQWRVDFVVDPADTAEERQVQHYFRQIFPLSQGPPAYDHRRFPSYGPGWRALPDPWVRRLGELGVYSMAGESEGGPSG